MSQENVLIKANVFAAKCTHNKYTLDIRHAFVACGICGEKLNPLWVIEQLCNKESRAVERVKYLTVLADAAKNKNRCKCEFCHKITRIEK